MIMTNTHELSTDNGPNLHAIANCISSKRVHTLVTRGAPRRMYLCDVPLFFKRGCSRDNSTDDDDDINFVRLMGTIVEIKHHSSPPSSTDPHFPPPIVTHEHASMLHKKSVNLTADRQMVQFMIDDGTGVLEVFSDGREVVGGKNTTDIDNGTDSLSRINNAPLIEQKQFSQDTNYSDIDQQSHPTAMTMLEELLSSSQSPLAVGQTVDCIGRLQSFVDTVNKDGSPDTLVDNYLDTSHTDKQRQRSSASASRIFLAASSISLVKNPQLETLRQLELSLSSRLDDGERLTRINNINNNSKNNLHRNNIHQISPPPPPPPPKNRILIGGYLERKLNPLYHCNQEGSVYLNLEDAFHFIKHSKDDGGITSKELALLVGAFESNEILAVNLTVERLREDCRIYLNQGKWFPM